MSLEEARKNLHTWLEDLDALRSHIDLNNPAASDFSAAWSAALSKAKEAAAIYTVLVNQS